MKIARRCLLALLLLAALPVALPAVLAQDDQEPEAPPLRFYVQVDAWSSQPVGTEYEPATKDPGTTVGPEVLGIRHEASLEAVYKVGVMLRKDVGELRASWFGTSDHRTTGEVLPGSFIFGQTLSQPLLAGFANDGLADGFESEATTRFSELRFDFMRTAFHSDAIQGKWFVGVRRTTHDRDLSATYFALSPDLPALLPPRPDLEPLPEEAEVSSQYKGRGIEGGLEFRIPVVAKRVEFEAGFALGVLRGKTDAAYSSTNWAYLFTPDSNDPDSTEILAPPYDELSDPAVALATDQASFTTRLHADSRTTTSPMIDMFLGVRGRVWKDLELLLGFRTVFYGGVGVDLKPAGATVTTGAVNVRNVTEVDRSVEYQGAYFGAAYTF